jgi:DNA-binding GntR family transcriptional regulator
MMQRLTRMTLKDQAKQAIRELITQARFVPGSRVNVGYLSKQLGVSRTPISQALAELEEEGLLQHNPNQGYVMSQMTTEMAVDLYIVREHLETLAVKLAIPKISSEAVARMRAKAEEQKRIVESGDLLGYSRSTFEFHNIVYEACGNWALAEVLTMLAERARPINIDITTILDDLYQDHLDLVDAFEARDAGKAADIMVKHTNRVKELIVLSADSNSQNSGSADKPRS